MRSPLPPILLAISIALALALACASPGVVPVQQAGQLENPARGFAVRIERVSDDRDFQDFAGRSFTPTLANDDGDPVLRSRAVGRSTRAGGAPGANVFLAPPLSVETVVAEAAARSLRAAGFRVLESGDTGYESAAPLRLGIEQLWMMKNPRTAPAFAACEIRVRVAGPVPGLVRGAVVEVRRKVARGGWSREMWRQALERGLEDWTKAAIVELASVRDSLEAGKLQSQSRVPGRLVRSR